MFMVPHALSSVLSTFIGLNSTLLMHAVDVSAVVFLSLFVEQYARYVLPYHELFAYSIAARSLLWFQQLASSFMYSSF